MILLYDKTEKEFNTNGLGALPDFMSCDVSEEVNGPYEVEASYPVNGYNYSELKTGRIIYCKPNPFDAPEPFRIYRITKPINKVTKIYAQHISYDLAGIPVLPFTANSCAEAITGLGEYAAIDCPFIFWTDKDVASKYTLSKPANIRSMLSGTAGSILDVYGKGEYKFEGYSVKLYTNRGSDFGVSLRYGKNITSLEQDENIASMYTGICPYWYNDDQGVMFLSEKVVKAEGNFPYENILTVDFSSDWQEKPTEEQLRARADRYIKENDIGKPKISLNVSFVDLVNPELKALEQVHLCDTVYVAFPSIGVDAKAEVIKTVYNALTDKYNSVEIGDAKSTLAQTVSNAIETAEKAPTSSFLENAIAHAGKLIQGVLGGHVIVWNNATKSPNNPNEILIMDTDDIKTAKNVWRWNLGGLGHSSTGYSGDYDLAMTMDGKINASMILTGILQAVEILMGEQTVEFPDGTMHYPVEMYPDGTAYFGGELHIGDIDPRTKVNVANISKSGAATFSNLTVSTGKIIGSEYESMKDETDKSKSTRMKLDSGALEFYRGDYQQNTDGNYTGDEKQAELTTNDKGVALNATNGNRASLGSEGTDVFYTEYGEGYFGAAIHGNNNSLDGMDSVTANTFHGNLDGNASSADEANHASSADSASEADHASSSDSATEANHASSADSATSAGRADYASYTDSAHYWDGGRPQLDGRTLALFSDIENVNRALENAKARIENLERRH